MDGSLILALSLWTADYYQTSDIRRHPPCEETNPILGKHPSQGKINRYFAAGALMIPALHYTLPGKWGQMYTYAIIGAEGKTVFDNAKIGLKIRF
jgi:hypothetical protein